MVEHYSHKIQNVIQKELFKAQKSIKIAVAWFTNDLLFQPLLLKLQAGVSVELILNKDEINDSAENEIDFNTFVEVGGVLHWNTTKTLMHEKFCIIDDSVVIYGSYNWTNKAEYNDESIAVSKDEFQTLNFYSKLFEELSNRYPVASKNKAEYPNKPLCDFEETKQESNIRPETSYEVDFTVFEDRWVKIARCKNSFDGSRAYYIIDVASNVIISDKYEKCDTAGRCEQEISPLIALKNECKCFFYDTRKHLVIELHSYDDIKGSTSNPVFFVCKENKWGIVDINNKVILRVEYDQIEDFKKQTYLSKYSFNGYFVKKRSKYGLFAEGQFVFDCIYDKLCLDGENPSTLNGKQGLIDRNGEVIIDFDYDEIQYESQIKTVYDKSCGRFYLLRKRDLYGVYLIDYAYTNGCLTRKPDNLMRFDVFESMRIQFSECYKFVQSLLNKCHSRYEHEKIEERRVLFNKRRSGEIVSVKDKLQSKQMTIAAFYDDEKSLKVANEALEKIHISYPVLRMLLCDVNENTFLSNGLCGYGVDVCPCLALMCNGHVISFWNGKKNLSDWIIFDMFKDVAMADKYR